MSAPGVLAKVYAVAIHRTWYDLLHENIALDDALSTKEVFQVAHILEQEIEKARKLVPTAKLWIQHFDRVITLLRFIWAERTGDWDLHIMSVREMLHTCHAAVHLPYAKSATFRRWSASRSFYLPMIFRSTSTKDTSLSAEQTSSGLVSGLT